MIQSPRDERTPRGAISASYVEAYVERMKQ
jgi:hypothetical protein